MKRVKTPVDFFGSAFRHLLYLFVTAFDLRGIRRLAGLIAVEHQRKNSQQQGGENNESAFHGG